MKKSSLVILLISVVILSSVVVYSADAAGIPKKAISTVARFLKADLPTTTVFNDQANTYTAGQKQTFQADGTTSGLNFAGVASDPSGVSAGDVWRNTASDALKLRGASTTQTIPTLEKTETFTGTTTLNSLILGGQMDLSGNTLKSSGHVYTFPGNTGTILMTNGSGSSLTSIPTSITGTANNITASASTGAITLSLGNSVVVNNKPNTYTAGNKQTFQSSSTTAGLNFAGVASDPSGVSAGDVWRNTASDIYKVRTSNTTKTIPAYTGTCSSNQILSYSVAGNQWSCVTPIKGTIRFNSAGTIANNQANIFLGANSDTTAILYDVEQMIATSGTIGNLYVGIGTASAAGANSWIFTVEKNEVTTLVACTITNAATTCSDTTDSFTVSPGDRIDIHITKVGTITATAVSAAVTLSP